MSFWTNLRDVAESPIKIAGGLASGLVSHFMPKEKQPDNSVQNKMISDQIQAYRDQTALTKQALDQTRASQDVEKRRIEQKQIRSLRGNYRAAGIGANMMGAPSTPDMNTKLGG